MRELLGRKQKINLVSYIILILVACFVIGPILWGVLTSFKLEECAITYPPTFLPKPFTLENYEKILFHSPAPKYFSNSLILAISSTALSLVVALYAAYAISRFDFRGRSGVLFFILSMAFIPGITVLVPLYMLSRFLGLYDTYFNLILVYSAWQIPLVTWLVKGFVDNLPPSVEEAALLDGCSKWGVLVRITLPNIVSGMIAAALMVFIFVWNDFLIATALTSSTDMRNVQMGLRGYLADLGIFWSKFMVFTTLAILPPIILYALLHKEFVKGLAGGWGK